MQPRLPALEGIADARPQFGGDTAFTGRVAKWEFANNATPWGKAETPAAVDSGKPFCRIILNLWTGSYSPLPGQPVSTLKVYSIGGVRWEGYLKVWADAPALVKAVTAIVDDELARAVGDQPATQPESSPDTQPERAQWSQPVNGMRARIDAGRYLTKRRGMAVGVQFENTSGQPVSVDFGELQTFVWKVLDVNGREVEPAKVRRAEPAPSWYSIAPGQQVGRILGTSQQNRDGRMVIGFYEWQLKPGRYTIHCTLGLQSGAPGLPEGQTAWKGSIELPSVRFEVIAEVSDEDLLTAAGRVRAAHPEGDEAMWKALAELVRRGMTVRQLQLVLPPDKRFGQVYNWSGLHFWLHYAVDDSHLVEANGVGLGLESLREGLDSMVLGAPPQIVKGTPTPMGGLAPTTQPTTAPATQPSTQPQANASPAERRALSDTLADWVAGRYQYIAGTPDPVAPPETALDVVISCPKPAVAAVRTHSIPKDADVNVLALPVQISNRSATAIQANIAHEWYGGEWPPTDLYVAILQPGRDAPLFMPVFLVGETGERTVPTAVEPGKSASLNLRVDWPGTGSVRGVKLVDRPGVYKMQLLLAFDADGKRQYVQSEPIVFSYQPGQPATAPEQAKWSELVNGLRARIEAGKYLTKSLGMEVSLQFGNDTGESLALDYSELVALRWQVLDESGKQVAPQSVSEAEREPKWGTIPPGAEQGRTLGSSTNNRDGKLTIGTSEWRLRPGNYTLAGTMALQSDAPGKPPRVAAWKGSIELPSVRFEVIAEVSDEDLQAAAKRVRAGHPEGGGAMWKALAELVHPGMTVRQMQLVLPPDRRFDRNQVWYGLIFWLHYAVDDGHLLKATGRGLGSGEGFDSMAVYGPPKIVKGQPAPSLGFVPADAGTQTPTAQPAPSPETQPTTQPATEPANQSNAAGQATTQPAERPRTFPEIIAARPAPKLADLAERSRPEKTGPEATESFWDILKLRGSGDRTAVPVLAEILASNAGSRRIHGYAAAQALFRIGGKEALAALDKHLLKLGEYNAKLGVLYVDGWEMPEPARSEFIEKYLLNSIGDGIELTLTAERMDGGKIRFSMTIENASDSPLDLHIPPDCNLFMRAKDGQYSRRAILGIDEYALGTKRARLQPGESRTVTLVATVRNAADLRKDNPGIPNDVKAALDMDVKRYLVMDPTAIQAVAMFEQVPMTEEARKRRGLSDWWIGRAVSKPVAIRLTVPPGAAPAAATQPEATTQPDEATTQPAVRGPTVAGLVRKAPGGPPAAGVTVTMHSARGGSDRTAVTDDQGRYAFQDVPYTGMAHVLQVGKHGPGVWTDDVRLFVPKDASADDTIAGTELHAEPSCTVSGVVKDADTGKGVPGIRIRISTMDRNYDSLVSNEQGEFTLHLIPREIQIDCVGSPDRYWAPDEGAVRKLTVKAGDAVKGVDFVIRSAPAFSGRVLLPDGKPAANVPVLAEVRWSHSTVQGGKRIAEAKARRQARIAAGLEAAAPPPDRSSRASGFVESSRGEAGIGMSFRFKTDSEGRFRGFLRRPEFGMPGVDDDAIDIVVIVRTTDLELGAMHVARTTTIDPPPDSFSVTLAKTASARFEVANPDGQLISKAKPRYGSFLFDYINIGYEIPEVTPAFANLGKGSYRATGLVPGWDYRLRVGAEGYKCRKELKVIAEPGQEVQAGRLELDWWGSKAVPGLMEQLGDEDPYRRSSACRELASLGPLAEPAIGRLVEVMGEDKTNWVRFGAARALGMIGPAAKDAVPALILALEQDKHGVPRESATALGRIGDLTAIGPLKIALIHADQDARLAAAEALDNPAFRQADPSIDNLLRLAGKSKRYQGVDLVMAALTPEADGRIAKMVQDLCCDRTANDTTRHVLGILIGKPHEQNTTGNVTAANVLAWWWSFPLSQSVPLPAALTQAKMERLWEDLKTDDIIAGEKAVRDFAAGGDAAVAYLAGKLQPLDAGAVRIALLISQLDDDKQSVRQQAEDELSLLGQAARDPLKVSLSEAPSAEAQARIEQLLGALDIPFPARPATRRIARAIRVLELIGSDSEAKAIEALAAGQADTCLREQAQAVLRRLRMPRLGKLSAEELGEMVIDRAVDGGPSEYMFVVRPIFKHKFDQAPAEMQKRLIRMFADEVAVLEEGSQWETRGTLHDRSYLVRYLGDMGAREELLAIVARHNDFDCCAAPSMIDALVSFARPEDVWLLAGKIPQMSGDGGKECLHEAIQKLTGLKLGIPKPKGNTTEALVARDLAHARAWAEALARAGIGPQDSLHVVIDETTRQLAVMTLKEGSLWYECGPLESENDLAIGWRFLPAGKTKWVDLPAWPSMGELHEAAVSADRKHLAVVSVGEGHPILEVFELPAMIAGKTEEPIQYVDPYPGWVSIVGWEGGKLRVCSDMPLTHSPRNEAGRVPASLEMDEPRDYLLDPTTGTFSDAPTPATQPAKAGAPPKIVKGQPTSLFDSAPATQPQATTRPEAATQPADAGMIDAPQWAKAALTALPGWEIGKLDAAPSIVVGNRKGFRLTMGQGRKTYPSLMLFQQYSEERLRNADFVMVYQHMELAVFPGGELSAGGAGKIAWTEWEDELPYFKKVVYMGQGMQMSWYARAAIFNQEKLRAALELEGGDDRLALLTEAMSVQDQGTITRNSCIQLLAAAGDKAVPYIKSAVEGTQDGWKAIAALGYIQTDASTDYLKALYQSDKARMLAESALIHEPLRKAAKQEYLDMLKRRRYVFKTGDACAQFDWQEAIPLLDAIYKQPQATGEFESAFRNKRILEGRPVPAKIDQTQKQLLEWSYSKEPPTSKDLAAAKATLLASKDTEAAIVVAIRLSMAGFKASSNRIDPIQNVGREVLRELPRKQTAEIVERLAKSLAEDPLRERTAKDLLEIFPAGR